MPSQKQQFSFPGYTSEQLLSIAYGTLLELGWDPKYAGPNAIVGYTARRWNKYDQVVVAAADELLIITSNMIHGESFDLMGKNKKNIKDYITAFEKVRSSEVNPEWPHQIEILRQQTVETVAEQTKQAAEVDSVMNFSGSNLYATYTIIAINLIVFTLMAFDGAGIFEPNGITHIKWGSNYTPLTLTGDWWRLFSCMFIHFGILHLAMNSYALYMAGAYLEPMLGKAKFVTAYLCTGLIASIASLWWHKEGVNSAGASGAIFGLYGLFLALLLTNLIPKQIRKSLLQSIGFFVVFNLAFGMKSGIDNAAHVGGLISGILIGFIFYPLLKTTNNRNKQNLALFGIVAGCVLIAGLFLDNASGKFNAGDRKEALNQLKEISFPDTEKFYAMYNEFAQSDGKIVGMLEDDTTSYGQWLNKNETSINHELTQSTNIIAKMKQYNVSDLTMKKAEILEQLLNARKEEILVIKQLAQEDNASNRLKLAEIRNKQHEILSELKSAN